MNLQNANAFVRHDDLIINAQAVCEAINDMGFDATLATEATVSDVPGLIGRLISRSHLVSHVLVVQHRGAQAGPTRGSTTGWTLR